MNYGFPQKLRLADRSQFEQVFASKQKIFSGFFTFYFGYNDLLYPRLGIGVSKKVIKNASRRNYFKRIIKEEFRLNQHKLKKVDLLIFVNNRSKDSTKKEARSQLKDQIEKLL